MKARSTFRERDYVEVAVTDEIGGPGSGGITLGIATWIRTPGGDWMRTERPSYEVEKVLKKLGLEVRRWKKS